MTIQLQWKIAIASVLRHLQDSFLCKKRTQLEHKNFFLADIIAGLGVYICRAAVKKSIFSCKSCRRAFTNREDYLDLTILEGTQVYDENTTPGTELFRSVASAQ